MWKCLKSVHCSLKFQVRLYREDSPDQAVHSVILGQSSFFYLPALPIDNKTYVLQLESSLSPNAYSFEQPSITFCANTSFYHFTFPFEPRIKSVEQEVTQGSVLALPVAIIVLLLAYHYSKILPLFSHSLYVLSTITNPSKNQISSENISTETTNVRRKTRPKRVP